MLAGSPGGGHRLGADEAAGQLVMGTLRSHPRAGSSSEGAIITHPLTSEGADASEDGTGRGTPMAVFSSTGAGWWRDGAGGLRAKVGASHDDNLAVGTISTQDDNGTNHVVVEQLETAATLTSGSSPNSAIPGRHAEDDVNLVFALQPGPGDGGEVVAHEVTVAPALDGMAEASSTDRGARVVSYRKAQKAHDPLDCERWEEADQAGALTGHGTVSGEAITVTVDLQNGALGHDGVAGTLDSEGQRRGNRGQALAFMEGAHGVTENPVTEPITTGGGKPGQGYPAVRQDMLVRRLTPLECTRLQGFPDTWLELDCGTCGPTETSRSRALLRILWSTAGQEAGEGRGSGVAASLLTPEVLLAGLHGGWISWSLAGRCAASAGAVQGEDVWPEGFVRQLWKASIRSAPHRRELFEQLGRELGRSVSELPLEEAQAAETVLRAGLWTKASAQWVLRLARSAHEASGHCGSSLSDSVRYRQLGNAVCMPVAEWLGRRMLAVHRNGGEAG